MTELIQSAPKKYAQTWLQGAAYPVLWIWLGVCFALVLESPENVEAVAAIKGAGVVGFLLFLELRYPLQSRWGMTWRLVVQRDLVLAVANLATGALLSYGLLLLAIDLAQDTTGPMTGQPLWLQIVVGLIVFELLQYSVHRAMHVGSSGFSRFLWRIHAIHHLPQQLYLVMHLVFHPLNAVVVRLCVQLLPLWILGFDPLAVFFYGSIIGLHGTISHLNFDMRLGWMNYVFVGPELHRHHHSASSHEAMNYGAALSILDQMFGTFHYHPGTHPCELGLREEDGYPGQIAPVQALLFPFLRQLSGGGARDGGGSR